MPSWWFQPTLRILGMSRGVKTTAPGVSLGGSGVSIGGVRIPRAFKKYAVKMGIFPRDRGENKKCLNPPASDIMHMSSRKSPLPLY